MRISDWSSDVCSSDLLDQVHRRLPATVEPGAVEAERRARAQAHAQHLAVESLHGRKLGGAQVHVIEPAERHGRGTSSGADTLLRRRLGMAPLRSEEHTSELQSLMRNSYAVFCFTKKQ